MQVTRMTSLKYSPQAYKKGITRKHMKKNRMRKLKRNYINRKKDVREEEEETWTTLTDRNKENGRGGEYNEDIW